MWLVKILQNQLLIENHVFLRSVMKDKGSTFLDLVLTVRNMKERKKKENSVVQMNAYIEKNFWILVYANCVKYMKQLPEREKNVQFQLVEIEKKSMKMAYALNAMNLKESKSLIYVAQTFVKREKNFFQ